MVPPLNVTGYMLFPVTLFHCGAAVCAHTVVAGCVVKFEVETASVRRKVHSCGRVQPEGAGDRHGLPRGSIKVPGRSRGLSVMPLPAVTAETFASKRVQSAALRAPAQAAPACAMPTTPPLEKETGAVADTTLGAGMPARSHPEDLPCRSRSSHGRCDQHRREQVPHQPSDHMEARRHLGRQETSRYPRYTVLPPFTARRHGFGRSGTGAAPGDSGQRARPLAVERTRLLPKRTSGGTARIRTGV